MTINNARPANNVFSRFIIYSLTVFGVTVSLPIIIDYGDIVVFSENGPVEWLQFLLLTIAASILLISSRHSTCSFRELLSILSFTAMFAAIRELDMILDRYIPVAGWSLPAFFCIMAAGFIYWRQRDAVTAQMTAFIDTRAFSLLWSGFIVAVPFAQLVGHGAFLQLLMGDDYVRDYKRVIEELGELMGYLFILAGSVEAALQQKEEGNWDVVKKMA